MSKLFSLSSWNIEHFKGRESRSDKILSFLKEQDADIFGLFEVEGKQVFNFFVNHMPDYTFHITEGPQIQEVLVGVKRTLASFFTQKVEFKSGNKYLRPGALLTVTVDGKNYTILFLHTKSSTQPIGLGIRDDQFRRAFKLKRRLDKIADDTEKANFIFLGDLNTMGMKYPYQRDIVAEIELKKLDREARRVKMKRLTKNSDFTWWNGSGSKYKPGDLDHIIASDSLKFKQFRNNDIDVRGWPSLETETEQSKWINDYSDHGLLYLEVQRPTEGGRSLSS
jgi:exonuclease III